MVFIGFIKLESVGQFSIPIQPWAKSIENRVLIVELTEENPKEIKKLQKKGTQALKEYKESLSERNNKLKELIPKYWPYNNKIEFKKTSEVEEIVKKKDERYIILNYRYTEEIRQSVKTYYSFNVYTILIYYPEYGKALIKNYKLDDNGNGTSSFLARGQYIFKISLPQSFLNERDIKFAFHQFKDCIERAKTEGWPMKMSRYGFKIADFNPNSTLILKDKILLIPKELLTINENQIMDEYKSSFKIIPLSQIDSLLKSDMNNEYAYYNIVWSDKTRYWTLLIIDNSTGKILAENPTTDKKFQLRINVPIGTHSLATLFKTSDVNFVINTEHFKKLTSQIENGK